MGAGEIIRAPIPSSSRIIGNGSIDVSIAISFY
jgi:hypothetical protein